MLYCNDTHLICAKQNEGKKESFCEKKTPLFVRRGLFPIFHVLDKDMALCWYNTEFSYYFFLKVSCTFDHNLILFVTCMLISWQSKEKKTTYVYSYPHEAHFLWYINANCTTGI